MKKAIEYLLIFIVVQVIVSIVWGRMVSGDG